MKKQRNVKGMKVIGTSQGKKQGVFKLFNRGTHPADVGMLLDQQGIAVRTGHHCAMPIMDQYCIPGTARASFSIYNTKADVDALFTAI